MPSRRRLLRVVAVALIMTAAPWPRASAGAPDPIQFILIQPGSPGTTEEAAPVMARLADYLAARLPGHPPVRGLYVNTPEDAAVAVVRTKPRLGIVTLPYYLEQRTRHNLRPQLATRPGGRTEDRYRLLVASANTASSWEELRGIIAGPLCHNADGAARLTFQRSAAELPFQCQPTERLLRAARRVIRGELSGVLVTDEQFASLTALGEGKQLRVLHETAPLPPPLVVTFGEPDAPLHAIIQILLGMKDDPAAGELRSELRTDGFGPVDTAAIDALHRRMAP
ncbi:MAG: PhnD/SsuA/transferrin family substrate-binding protein [Nitrospirota bacterium]